MATPPKTLEEPFTADFCSNVEQTMSRWHVPGLSMAVVQHSRTWTRGWGIASQTNPSVDASTLFYSASTTKAMLAASWAIYMASDANQSKPAHDRISFTTPLVSILGGDFLLPDTTQTQQITLEDALSHRTGLTRHDLSYGWEGTSDLRGAVRALRHLPIAHPLRTRMVYCNTPFMAASLALERVTGKSFGDYVREVLWEPLGMTSTYGGYWDAKERALRTDSSKVLAEGHSWSKVPGEPDEANGMQRSEGNMKNLDVVAGAGYAISCAEDYVKWMRALLQLPQQGDNKSESGGAATTSPLTSEILSNLFAPRTIIPSDDEEHFTDTVPFDSGILLYALGWFVSSYRSHRIIWHLGGLVGAGSLVMIVPDLGFGVSLFANGEHGGIRMRGLAIALLDEVLGVPSDERDGQKRVEEALMLIYTGHLRVRENARKDKFPDAPDEPVVPHAVALQEYVGEYFHPGYGPITIEMKEGGLEFSTTCSWPCRFAFEHVNAENWLVTRYFSQSPMTSCMRARSRVGADGRVEGFGIAMETDLPNEMIFFDKKR